MNALVIEADASFGRVLSRSLGGPGLAVDASVPGENVLRRMRHGRYDLVIVDAGLVLELDVVSVVRELRVVDASVPILVIGERNRGCRVAEALTAGADDYLVRPFDVEELVARMHALARRAKGVSDARSKYRRNES